MNQTSLDFLVNSKEFKKYLWYLSFCESPKNNGHNHHIIPKSIGGTDTSHNLIYLTPLQHTCAHYLLRKAAYHSKDNQIISACVKAHTILTGVLGYNNDEWLDEPFISIRDTWPQFKTYNREGHYFRCPRKPDTHKDSWFPLSDYALENTKKWHELLSTSNAL